MQQLFYYFQQGLRNQMLSLHLEYQLVLYYKYGGYIIGKYHDDVDQLLFLFNVNCEQ